MKTTTKAKNVFMREHPSAHKPSHRLIETSIRIDFVLRVDMAILGIPSLQSSTHPS